MPRMENTRMRRISMIMVVLLFLSPATLAIADRLEPDALEYLGYFTPPSQQAPGDMWQWGMGGVTLIPDCMGRVDPSPDDDFPGCIGAFGNVQVGRFGVFDIVPPGEQAQQVVPFYSLGEGLPADTLPGVGSVQYWDVLYDKGDDYCRIWWTYGTFYVRINEDPPFLGMSSCDPDNPDPQGMWDFGPEWIGTQSDDPFHSAKMYGALSIIPQNVADRFFDGKQMMMGLGVRGDGGVGRSQGPSLYVRDLSVPTSNPSLDATPLLWYGFTGFVEWWDEPEMDGGAARHWTQAEAFGAEFITTSTGDAVVMPWREPTINLDDYPCSDPTAYRDNDPTTPPPCEVPVCWYGVASCPVDPIIPEQMPSFWDNTSTGELMPPDCNIRDSCEMYTGMHCQSMRPFLIFYGVDELAGVYDGDVQHNAPQPYAKVPLENYFINGTGCGTTPTGSTYDPDEQLLFVTQGMNDPAVHVFRLAANSPPPPPPPPPAPTVAAALSHGVDLSWTGLTGQEVLIGRDFVGIATTENDGEYRDEMAGWDVGEHTYHVCEALTRPYRCVAIVVGTTLTGGG